MKYTIRDNNGNLICSVESTNPVNDEVSLESINNELKNIDNECANLNKSVEMYSIISDTRAMEALGYISIESEEAKATKENIFKRMWEKIQAFFKRIGEVLKHLWDAICKGFTNLKNKIFKNKKKTEATASAMLQAVKRVNGTREAAKEILKICKNDNSTETILNTVKTVATDGNITDIQEEKIVDTIEDKLNKIINDLTVKEYFLEMESRIGRVQNKLDPVDVQAKNIASTCSNLIDYINSFWSVYKSKFASSKEFNFEEYKKYTDSFSSKWKKYYNDAKLAFGQQRDEKDINFSEQDKLNHLRHLLELVKSNSLNIDESMSKYKDALTYLEKVSDKFSNFIEKVIEADGTKYACSKVSERVFDLSSLTTDINGLIRLVKNESICYAKILNLCAAL